MTPPTHFSLWRHLSRAQIVLSATIGLIVLVMGVLAPSVYLNIVATNSAFTGGYTITDLSDIQRAILILQIENSKAFITLPPDFESVELRRALLSSQLRLARTEAAGNAQVSAGLNQIQGKLDEYTVRLAALRDNPSPEQVAAVAPELESLLSELDSQIQELDNREENLFFSTISNALRTQRFSQSLLLVLSVFLVLFSVALILSLRRTIKSEFDHAYHLLEEEVAERRQIEQELRNSDVELREANQDLQSLNARLQKELTLARKIQQGLLPPPCPQWDGLDIVCHSLPASEVGGDFYAYHVLDKERFTLAVGDISGKGLPAALLMATTLAYFDSTFASALPPSDTLAQLDQTLVRYTNTTQQNCALCYIEIISPTSPLLNEISSHPATTTNGNGGLLRVANAGGIPPYIRRVNGEVESLDVRGMPLGIGVGAESGYQAVTAPLFSGDMVILTSDGVVEAHVTGDQLFSFERLEQAIATGPTTSAQAMLDYLNEEVSTFIGEAELQDDLTIVVLQIG